MKETRVTIKAVQQSSLTCSFPDLEVFEQKLGEYPLRWGIGQGWEAGGSIHVGYFEEHLIKKTTYQNIASSEHIRASKKGGQVLLSTAEEEKRVAFPI